MTRSGLAALGLPATAVTAALWLVVACSVGGAPGTSSAPGTNGATGAVASPAALSPALPETPQPSAAPIETLPASGSIGIPQPPAGSLTVNGSAPVAGLLGTYCWNGACLDAVPFSDRGPDLPDLTLPSSAATLSFSLEDVYPFADWSASYVDDNGDVQQLGAGEPSFDPDAAGASLVPVTVAEFPAPPSATETIVQIFVRFAEGGDASYGWNGTVP
jgi:hypothetical protein